MESLKPEMVSETLTVYQKPGVFSYGTDAVMLARYVLKNVSGLNSKKMCDLCTGTGIVPLLLCDANVGIDCTGLEVNGEACEIAAKSAKDSGYADRFKVIRGDVKLCKQHFDSEQFDFLTCNPPYMTANCGKMCDFDYKTIARHEVLCNIDDIFKAAFYLLRTGGDIFIVYRTDRLESLFAAAYNNRFSIKNMTLACSGELPGTSKLAVCRAKKDAAEGLKLEIARTDELCGK